MTNRSEISSLGEFELIRRYFSSHTASEHVLLGVGDDCAVLSLPVGEVLAVSVDTQLPKVHFPAHANPSDIASRALRCAASDLAAMSATPLGFTLALTLPAVDELWLAAFSQGLLEAAQQLRCPLIGGDTTRGALCISIQVHGSVPVKKMLKRSGAKIGDKVWVFGSLGDGAAALALLENRQTFTEDEKQYLQQRFYQPAIYFDVAVQLRNYASACIDVSDGLLADLAHICDASDVGAQIWCDALPFAQWKNSVHERQAQQWALCGGDDYRLCFTAAAQHDADLQAIGNCFCIGKIIAGSGVVALDSSHNPVQWLSHGYQHF
jgi:thiamine-monophosphate kinase